MTKIPPPDDIMIIPGSLRTLQVINARVGSGGVGCVKIPAGEVAWYLESRDEYIFKPRIVGIHKRVPFITHRDARALVAQGAAEWGWA